MISARLSGGVGALAIALGTGAWLAAVPWSAAADSDSSVVGLANSLGLPSADPVALTGSDPAGLTVDASYNSLDVFHTGDATDAALGNDLLGGAAASSLSDVGWTHAVPDPDNTSLFWAPVGQPTEVQTIGIAGLFGDTTEYQQFVEYESVDGAPPVLATGADAGTMEVAENILTTPAGFGNEFGDVTAATGSLASNAGDFTDLLTTPSGYIGPFGDIAHIFSEIVPLL
jgi:hypothetical protein